MSLENAVPVDHEDLMAEVEEAGERKMQLAQLLKNCPPSIFEDYDREAAVDTCEGIAMQFTKSKGYLCIWRILTAGFAEQNGRNAKLNGRITFDY